MGGRGSFATGKLLPFRYTMVGKVHGVKVLEEKGRKGNGNLPEESNSSKAYILHDKNGNFIRYREYNADHTAKFDIDYHVEPKLKKRSEGKVYHIHEYTDGVRNGKIRVLTKEEFEKYRKFFKRGVD